MTKGISKNRFRFILLINTLAVNLCMFSQSPKEQLAIANAAKLVSKNFYEEIPFTDKQGYIIIPVTINTYTYDYIFDTGGFNTVTSEIMKNANLLPLMEVETGSSNKIKSKIKLSKVPSLQIGQTSFEDVGVFNFDFSASPVINCYTNGGLIGKSVIREAIWQIDAQKSVIKISDDLSKISIPDKSEKIKIRLDKTLNPFLTLTINGKKEDFMLDLGYGGLISLTEKTASNLKLNNPLSIEGEGDISANGTVKEKTFAAKLEQLSIGKTELKNQIAYYSASNNYNLLGSELLKYFIMTLNFKDNELILSPYNDTKADFETFGFNINLNDDKIYISKIFTGLNAQKAGLLVNDEIISINGKLGSGISNCENYFQYNSILKTEKEITIQIKRGEEQKEFRLLKNTPFN